MSVDKRVPARSDAEVRRIAERTKAEFGVSRRRPVNILRFLKSCSLLTLYGRKKLVLLVVDDADLGGIDAKTEFSKDVVTITCKRGVRDRAEVGVGRDRMTLAHELGHAVLHHSVPMFKLVGAAGASDLARDGAHTSAEHQAKIFAAAFLIHDEDAAKLGNAQEISEEFGVSLQAAQVCFDRLNRKAERQRSSERVRKNADELIALLRRQPQLQPTYIADPCSCGMRTLRAIDATRVKCDSCGFLGERFQDGDQAG